jgi:hypothetical protein
MVFNEWRYVSPVATSWPYSDLSTHEWAAIQEVLTNEILFCMEVSGFASRYLAAFPFGHHYRFGQSTWLHIPKSIEIMVIIRTLDTIAGYSATPITYPLSSTIFRCLNAAHTEISLRRRYIKRRCMLIHLNAVWTLSTDPCDGCWTFRRIANGLRVQNFDRNLFQIGDN